MSDANHDVLIARLSALRESLPDMRLGQLISNMATVARGTGAGAIWEMEDHELMAAINWQLAELRVLETAEAH